MRAVASRRPTRAELEAARDKLVPDVIADDLELLFVGINPSLYSAALGQHFARPGNRFWPALHGAGFTPRLWSPPEQANLVEQGIGITNVVARATARADELSRDELVQGMQRLTALAEQHRIVHIAFLGITAYRTGCDRQQAVIGPQAERIGNAAVSVLPNPSGLNAHYQLADHIALLKALRQRIRGSRARACGVACTGPAKGDRR
ncbi:MAG: mismatch-specific DNA-glycosylase [Planctomycetales bacterium]|nr:mismatch-specific DNA-glycosylase [Planctomycetales bacterium]